MISLDRRLFLLVAGVAGLALSRRSAAQPKPVGRAIRVGYVLSTPPLAEMLGPEPKHPAVRGLLEELRKLGYVMGSNLVLEPRSAEEKFERLEAICVELAALRPDAIVVGTVEIAQAARKATSSIPIVLAISGAGSDPVAAGLVQSLARPGGNITGVVPDAGGEIYGKRVELLKQVAPALKRIAYLGLPGEWDSPGGRSARAAAQSLGIEFFHVPIDPKQYAAALDAAQRARADAILTSSHPSHHAHRMELVAFATRNRLPNMHAYRTIPPDGGLMSYGASAPYARIAAIIDRIVKGTPAAEIPIERPTQFQLLINQRAAKAIGLAIPPDVLLRADRVIE